MPARTEKLHIEQNSTFTHEVLVKDGKNIADLTGYSAVMQARIDAKSEPFLNITDGNGIIIDEPNGKITISLPPATTAAIKEKSGTYTLEITAPSGDTQRILQGKIDVSFSDINIEAESQPIKQAIEALEHARIFKDNYHNFIQSGLTTENENGLELGFAGGDGHVSGNTLRVASFTHKFTPNRTTDIWLNKYGIISYEESEFPTELPIYDDQLYINQVITDSTKIIGITNNANRTKRTKTGKSGYFLNDDILSKYKMTSGLYSGSFQKAIGGEVISYFENNAFYFAPDLSETERKEQIINQFKKLVINHATERVYLANMFCIANGKIWQTSNGGTSDAVSAFSGTYNIGDNVDDNGIIWVAVYNHYGIQEYFWLDIVDPINNIVRYGDSHDSYPSSLIYDIYKYIQDTGDTSLLFDTSPIAPFSFENLLYSMMQRNIIAQITDNNLTTVFQEGIHPSNGDPYDK